MYIPQWSKRSISPADRDFIYSEYLEDVALLKFDIELILKLNNFIDQK